MSDPIKHECGVALVRLLKPLEYYQAKYGTWKYGLNKLYLLMEKQHNRGQDGAGVVSVKLNQNPGQKYINRIRSNSASPIKDVFREINEPLIEIEKYNKDLLCDANWALNNTSFASEIYLGHLRYGTHGGYDIGHVQPVMRENNWRSRNLVLAGNFNLANVNEQFQKLIELGQHPLGYSDVITILEKVGHFLDRENQRLFELYKKEGLNNVGITKKISQNIVVENILSAASKNWDGGYTIAGVIGQGTSFITRDPWGIRPAFYYQDDEIVVAASERPVIQTVLNVSAEEVNEVLPGSAIVISSQGETKTVQIRKAEEKKACSFERIYFSRGSDRDIYQERKRLGKYLVPRILSSVDNDIENTVFSFIPNTAETAFYGMMEGIQDHLNNIKKQKIIEKKDSLTEKDIEEILSFKARMEKIAIKDVKLRTFITEDKNRDDLVGHVYDITYGVIRKNKDNLVIIDDSIVRGTTLKKSIFRILDRLNPKKIVVVSSSPQIRYPDCYGIDMAKLGDLVAFNAAIALLKERRLEKIINSVYNKCKDSAKNGATASANYVKEIYAPFTNEEISQKITELLRPEDINADTDIIYQTLEGLHESCPDNTGDWYFSGNYPTPGGNSVVNNSFINYIEGNNRRAY